MILINLGCGYVYHPEWINLDLIKSPGVIYGDVRKRLPFPDGYADVIYHSHVLEHLSRAEGAAFLKECWRVLKPGGIIRIAAPDLEQIAREYLKNLEKAWAGGKESDRLDYEWNKIEMLDQIIREKPGGEMIERLRAKPKNLDYILTRNGRDFLPSPGRDTTSSKRLAKAWQLLRRFRFSDLFHGFRKYCRERSVTRSGERHLWMYDRLDLKTLLERSGFQNIIVQTYDQSTILDWNRYGLEKSRISDGPRKPDSLYLEGRK